MLGLRVLMQQVRLASRIRVRALCRYAYEYLFGVLLAEVIVAQTFMLCTGTGTRKRETLLFQAREMYEYPYLDGRLRGPANKSREDRYEN